MQYAVWYSLDPAGVAAMSLGLSERYPGIAILFHIDTEGVAELTRCDPFSVVGISLSTTRGIAALNPWLIAAAPPGCRNQEYPLSG
jgi:hypothetical protein